MAQPMDPRNAIRRVSTAHLIFLGDLNRFKAKFLHIASTSAISQQPERQTADEQVI